MSQELEEYYNKFCEEKRLIRKYGQVEYRTSMKYIHEYLNEFENPSILDVGAGTGRYSVTLANEGFDVTAIELVKNNLGVLKAKKSSVKAYLGTALDLSRFKDDSFDMTLVFGPMYHLYTLEEQVQALKEASRVTKKNGIILVAYCMNEFSVLTYAFKENHVLESIQNGKLDETFHVQSTTGDLYHYVRIEDIDEINKQVNVERIQLVAADGPANYMRSIINEMDDETFEAFMAYHFATCERSDLLGASGHTLDILRNQKA